MSMAVYNIIRVLISASRLKIKLHVILQKNTFQQQKHLFKVGGEIWKQSFAVQLQHHHTAGAQIWNEIP